MSMIGKKFRPSRPAKKIYHRIVKEWKGYYSVSDIVAQHDVPDKVLAWVVPESNRHVARRLMLIDQTIGMIPRIKCGDVIPITKITCEDVVYYSAMRS